MPSYILENKDGAYLNVTSEFLSVFKPVERNPNFDVFDRDGIRIMLTRCSRLADDNDYANGRYGIDFNRRLPDFEEAREFYKNLPLSLLNTDYTGNLAFAASHAEDYAQKKRIYEMYYEFLFGIEPFNVYSAPHSGDVTRKPDAIKYDPRDDIDRWTAGVAALCGIKKGRSNKRELHSIHMSSDDLKSYPAIIDIGDFGLLSSQESSEQVAREIDNRYKERIMKFTPDYKNRVFKATMKRLKGIQKTRGTLNPDELERISTLDRFHVINTISRLNQYGEEMAGYQLDQFKDTIHRVLKKDDQRPGLRINHMFTGRKVGELLRLQDRIHENLLSKALQYECNRTYLELDPELIADIIIDIGKEFIS